MLIQNPGVLTKKASSAAKDFLAFQESKQGQTDYAEQGFRPLDPSIKVDVKGANNPSDPFPAPTTLLTIDATFVGWSVANKKYFDEKDGIVTKAARRLREELIHPVALVASAPGLARLAGPGANARWASAPASPWASLWSGSACWC